jgi:hypothetical protein
MADESLMEEMRAAMRGDRERAEERRRRESALDSAQPTPQVSAEAEPVERVEPPVANSDSGLETEATRARPGGWLRWMRTRRNG